MQPRDAVIDGIVDHDVIIGPHIGDLPTGDLEATSNLLFAVLASAPKPLFEHLRRRRKHEDGRVLDSDRKSVV